MTLEARRKNQGKQYTVVSPEDRVIRHWHRPGDHLPAIIGHNELAAELTYRLESMRREISRLRERLSRMVEEPGEGASPQSTADTPPPAKRDLVVEVLDEDDVVVISDVRQPMRHSRRVTPE